MNTSIVPPPSGMLSTGLTDPAAMAPVAGAQPPASQPVPFAPVIPPKDETEAQHAQRLFKTVATSPAIANIAPALSELITTPKHWWQFFAKSNSQLFLAAVAAYQKPADDMLKHGGDPKYKATLEKDFAYAEKTARKLVASLARGMPKEARERTEEILLNAARAGGQWEAQNEQAILQEKMYAKLAKDMASTIAELPKATDGERKSLRTRIEKAVDWDMKGMKAADRQAMVARLMNTSPDIAKQIAAANPSLAEMAMKQAVDAVTGIPKTIVNEAVTQVTTGGTVPPGVTTLAQRFMSGGGRTT